MSHFRRVETERWAPLTTNRSTSEVSEIRYWSKYKIWAESELSSGCGSCAWSPGPTRAVDGSPILRLACCSSLNVSIMGAPLLESRAENGFKSMKTSARTLDVCCGISWRSDGRLLACGDNSGNVYTMDTNSGSILRAFPIGANTAAKPKRGGAAARSTIWATSSKNTQMLASSFDDGSIAIWDVGAGGLAWRSSLNNSEPIRTLAYSVEYSPYVILAGSYDGNIYRFDFRNKNYESLLFNPSVKNSPIENINLNAQLLAACGGTNVMVFDLIAGKIQATWRNAHAKTSTAVALGTKHRVLSTGLDATVRSHSLLDTTSITVCTTAQPILALSWYCDTNIECYAISQANGKITTRRTPLTKTLTGRKRTLQSPKGGTYRYFMRGTTNTMPNEISIVGPSNTSNTQGIVLPTTRTNQSNKLLKSYDQALRKFNYAQALDEALATRDPVIVLSIMRELEHRNALTSALARRDEIRLEPLLAFLGTHLTNPRYAPLLIQVANTFLDLYAHSALGTVPAVDDALAKIHSLLRTEINAQHSLLNLRGHLQALIALYRTPFRQHNDDIMVAPDDTHGLDSGK
uniref:U3 small nucleolar RNA-associated protein 15 C-terminal domain-containing protein n=1 Tax=Aureoumbra lagunensis TaxID=44058 RepID=A0A7S3NRC1_9STRA|mmetsp:Transcript_18981/g.28662  ORF Transcript_18981/g.28662 Transcript_18981/m.28662 type:complete len:576 (+) Transcript_18981:53-1780(+)